MSASLVGSDMCIRDRLVAALERFGELGRALGELWESSVKLQRASRGFPSCLLYTSDAADDM
eukprot:1269062-Alexandrium_andersonii.AAC.1